MLLQKLVTSCNSFTSLLQVKSVFPISPLFPLLPEMTNWGKCGKKACNYTSCLLTLTYFQKELLLIKCISSKSKPEKHFQFKGQNKKDDIEPLATFTLFDQCPPCITNIFEAEKSPPWPGQLLACYMNMKVKRPPAREQ